MNTRSESKQASRHRILDAAAARLRQEGLSGAAIAPVMKDAELTHGAFYSHFASKDELTSAALTHALAENRRRWIGKAKDRSWRERLIRLGKRYLTPAHRDDLPDSCALAALASDAPRSDSGFRNTYEAELRKSLSAICGGALDDVDSRQLDDAITFMALCVGGITLSRAVENKKLSSDILRACQGLAGRIARDTPDTELRK